MAFIENIIEKAKTDKQKIVLPESMDARTYEAAQKITAEGIANVVLVGTEAEVAEFGKGFDLTGVEIIDPYTDPNRQKYIDKFVELRAKKGVTPEQAEKQMMDDYMYYACLMCKCGDADGVVSGACHSTGNTIRPALQLLKTKPGIKSVSGYFVIEVPNCKYGEEGTFVFADCAVNTEVDAEKLAEIAGLSAESFADCTGKEPKVAMVSFSTKGSAKSESVSMMQEATALAKEKFPTLKIDGELQVDAALDATVGKLKAPDSTVAGEANVLVFPSIDAGNIAYKIAQRLSGGNAYGPILQGISMPVNDLSRGCVPDDIVGVVAITAVQAQAAKQA